MGATVTDRHPTKPICQGSPSALQQPRVWGFYMSDAADVPASVDDRKLDPPVPCLVVSRAIFKQRLCFAIADNLHSTR